MNTQHLLIQKSRLLAQHTQESTQRSPDPFPCEKVGSGLRERPGSERVGPGHKTLVSLVCALFATYPKVVQFVRKKKILRCYLTYFDTVLLFSDAM